jgi:hypothetical protein
MFCRLITLEDSSDVLTWRNNPVSREMSINSSVISQVEHSNWFAEMLANANHIGLIGEINGQKIGVIFMVISGGTSKVSINLNPLHRGKGFAGSLLRSSILEVQKIFPTVQQFIAKIKDTNPASMKIFVQNGFNVHIKKANSFIYILKPETHGVKRDV